MWSILVVQMLQHLLLIYSMIFWINRAQPKITNRQTNKKPQEWEKTSAPTMLSTRDSSNAQNAVYFWLFCCCAQQNSFLVTSCVFGVCGCVVHNDAWWGFHLSCLKELRLKLCMEGRTGHLSHWAYSIIQVINSIYVYTYIPLALKNVDELTTLSFSPSMWW